MATSWWKGSPARATLGSLRSFSKIIINKQQVAKYHKLPCPTDVFPLKSLKLDNLARREVFLGRETRLGLVIRRSVGESVNWPLESGCSREAVSITTEERRESVGNVGQLSLGAESVKWVCCEFLITEISFFRP